MDYDIERVAHPPWVPLAAGFSLAGRPGNPAKDSAWLDIPKSVGYQTLVYTKAAPVAMSFATVGAFGAGLASPHHGCGERTQHKRPVQP